MKIGRIERPKPQPLRRGEAMILFTVASYVLAISARAVEEIREAGETRRFGAAGISKVRQVLKRERKTYYVVDANAHLQLLPTQPTRLLLLHGTGVALSVDSIEGMAEVATVHPLPLAFHGAERTWYRGMVIVGKQVAPVINPQTLLTQSELAALRNEQSLSEPATA
jgi:chemotaxis signal transduction protein